MSGHPAHYTAQGGDIRTRSTPHGFKRALVIFAVVALVLMVAVSVLTSAPITQRRPADEPSVWVSADTPAVPTPAVRREPSSTWVAEVGRRTGVPSRAVVAYVHAVQWADRNVPGCKIEWNTLAGIGKVETNHGRHNGSAIHPNGRAVPEIFGPRLDGSTTATVRDTDGGSLDGDKKYDRAMGPLQFIPETWKRFAVDGNGDGKTDPHNIDDAAPTAANYLCSGNKDLSQAKDWTAAVLRYNASDQYATDVYFEAQEIADALPTD